MNGKKIFRTILAVGVMILMLAPVVSAQTSANILHGTWFKVKLGVKGYKVVTASDTVLGKGSGSISAYLHFDYSPGSYTVYTCTQNDLNPAAYTLTLPGTFISQDDIYGATYPQVWDFGSNPLVFNNGAGFFSAYPTFYTKITATDGLLKSASIGNVACGLYATLSDDDQGADLAVGSCSITGPLVDVSKVPSGCFTP